MYPTYADIEAKLAQSRRLQAEAQSDQERFAATPQFLSPAPGNPGWVGDEDDPPAEVVRLAAHLSQGPILIPGPNAHHPEYYQLIREIVSISEAKNQDYADRADPLRNFRKCAAFGVPPWLGILTRMSDKWSRLESLADGTDPAVTDESIEDTLQDLANYCLLAIVARRTMNDDGTDRAPLEAGTMAA